MRRFVALLICFVSISTVHAGVIEIDLSAAGDGLLTYDTFNKRAWLDLPETGGLELSELLAQMEPGGRLAGFQFATLEDVTALAASAGVNWMNPWTLPGTTGLHIYDVIEKLGWVLQWTGGVIGRMDAAFGQIAITIEDGMPIFDDVNAYFLSIEEPIDLVLNHNPNLYMNPTGGFFIDGPYTSPLFPELPQMGVGNIGPFWLYRAVPEPHSVALLMMGCVAVVGRGARCKYLG